MARVVLYAQTQSTFTASRVINIQNIHLTMKNKKALFSVFEKTKAVGDFAEALYDLGWEIIASGGTKTFLEGLGISVVDTADITGIKAVLDRRVATLCPQLHGGLLADEILHAQELEKLGWPFIDLVYIGFYPLQATMMKPDADAAAINNAVDIGGPTLVASANKGGRAVFTHEDHLEWAIEKIRMGGLGVKDLHWLQALAAAWLAEYQTAAGRFRVSLLRPD